MTRNSENIPQILTKHNFFENFFFLSTINEWNNLKPDICNSENVGFLIYYLLNSKVKLFKIHMAKPNSIHNCHNPKGIRLITRLCLGSSHLRKCKFKHSLQDYINPLCSCGNDIETSSHILLHSPTYSNEKMMLLNKIKNISYGILELSNTIITKTSLFSDSSFSDVTNTLILNSTIEHVIATKRFDGFIIT